MPIVRPPKPKQSIRIQETEQEDGKVVRIHLHPGAEVTTEGGWLVAFDGTQEVRVGPLTPEQALKLSEDLGYVAVE